MCCRYSCHPPLCYISGGLEEASVVVLLQALLSLCDEGAGALQTLATVCNLLRQLTQFHHLGHKCTILLCCDKLIDIHLLNMSFKGIHHCFGDLTVHFQP